MPYSLSTNIILLSELRQCLRVISHFSFDKLGNGLTVEGISDDGVIEAIRITDHPSFGIGVQWHAEFMPDLSENSLSRRLFEEFGKAAKTFID